MDINNNIGLAHMPSLVYHEIAKHLSLQDQCHLRQAIPHMPNSWPKNETLTLSDSEWTKLMSYTQPHFEYGTTEWHRIFWTVNFRKTTTEPFGINFCTPTICTISPDKLSKQATIKSIVEQYGIFVFWHFLFSLTLFSYFSLFCFRCAIYNCYAFNIK